MLLIVINRLEVSGMTKRNILFVIMGTLLFSFMFSSSPAYAKEPRYGVKIGDEKNNYTYCKDLSLISPDGDVMVKAYALCKKLSLVYSYDDESDLVTIKNESSGKRVELLLNKVNYFYYPKENTDGIEKETEYPCYYDKESSSVVIPPETLGNIINYKYTDINSENINYKIGLRGMLYFSSFIMTKEEIKAAVIKPTSKMMKRLKSYDYWGGQPSAGFDELHKDFSENVHTWIYDLFINNLTLSVNEKIYTSDKLTYLTRSSDNAIRYVSQITMEDGTVVEQDMEFIFFSTVIGGRSTIIRVASGNLSEVRVVK